MVTNPPSSVRGFSPERQVWQSGAMGTSPRSVRVGALAGGGGVVSVLVQVGVEVSDEKYVGVLNDFVTNRFAHPGPSVPWYTGA